MQRADSATLAPACPQCASRALTDRGAIARGRYFAGRALQPPWPGGRLYACADCALVFRHPRRLQAEYEALYAAASATVWAGDALRADQREVLAMVRAHAASGSVLDIGCYDAAMLAALGAGYTRCGVEASTAAAEVARGRGIEIVAHSVDALAQVPRQFDVVTATDVIEHVQDPLAFLRTLAARTAPGGLIVVSSGNSEAPAWRRFGGRYWYCAIPEHLSFVSPAWAERAAATLDLQLRSAQPYRYDIPAALLRRKRLNFVAKLALALPEALLRLGSAAERAAGPRVSQGGVGLFEDHVLLVFAKPAAATA